MANYALLGSIAFDLLNAPTAFDEQRSATFAEHAVLSGKPRLQAMGDNLTEITLQLKLHHKLAPVEPRYQALVSAKDRQEVLALVLGFSQFKGHFVITQISSQLRLTDENGQSLAREISLTLREFVGNSGTGLLGAALSIGANAPLASLIPQGLQRFVSKVAQLVNQGVRIYRQARQTIAAVKNSIAVIKSFAQNPLLALQQLPQVLGALGQTTQGLAEMVGLGGSFSLLTQGINAAQPFLVGMVELSDALHTAQMEFKRGLNASNLGNWFDLGVKAIDSADNAAQMMAKPAAELTAWLAIRADSPATNNAATSGEA